MRVDYSIFINNESAVFERRQTNTFGALAILGGIVEHLIRRFSQAIKWQVDCFEFAGMAPRPEEGRSQEGKIRRSTEEHRR